jgi:hypothetical protein
MLSSSGSSRSSGSSSTSSSSTSSSSSSYCSSSSNSPASHTKEIASTTNADARKEKVPHESRINATRTGQVQSMDGQFAAAYPIRKIDDMRQLLRSGYRVPSEKLL